MSKHFVHVVVCDNIGPCSAYKTSRSAKALVDEWNDNPANECTHRVQMVWYADE